MNEPLVRREDDGLFVFTDPNHPRFTYDFYILDGLPAEHWLRHMPEKMWVTAAHMADFRRLLEVSHG